MPCGPGEVHVLLAEQTAMARGMQGQPEGWHAPSWLTASEVQRLAGMAQPARRQEFIACRRALRQVLATATGVSAGQWHLDAPTDQAPCLNVLHDAPWWRVQRPSEHTFLAPKLSLSHSGSWLACACAPLAVGVDLELERPQRPPRSAAATLERARLACTPAELAWLQAIHVPIEREAAFVQCWSLKEALFKSQGTGIDFSRIRTVECRPANEAAPLLGPVLGWARSWQGHTEEGLAVQLTVCHGGQSLLPCRLELHSAVQWARTEDWVLVDVRELTQRDWRTA